MLYITTTSLNIRRAPVVSPDTLICVLPERTTVEIIEKASVAGWVKVIAQLNPSVTGYVSEKYLRPKNENDVDYHFQHSTALPEVHLIPGSGTSIVRNSANGRAFPLNESDLPFKDAVSSETKVQSIYRIIEYLDVTRNARYAPANSRTYCNIYAFDYCYLSKAYIPRVWWLPKAIVDITHGKSVPVQYDKTVGELNANMLYDWFETYGSDYGWRRTFDPDELQNAVNNGCCGIIVAKRVDLNRSGHIVACVPESDLNKAERISGKVSRPLQSQAGMKNYKYFIGNWWTKPQTFRGFGFWLHD